MRHYVLLASQALFCPFMISHFVDICAADLFTIAFSRNPLDI